MKMRLWRLFKTAALWKALLCDTFITITALVTTKTNILYLEVEQREALSNGRRKCFLKNRVTRLADALKPTISSTNRQSKISKLISSNSNNPLHQFLPWAKLEKCTRRISLSSLRL
jgi:hypothetical protein